MVADSIHILFGMALVAVLVRARRPEPYLVAALAAALPDIDIFLFEPLVSNGAVSNAVLAHRGFTHSLFAFATFVLAAWAIGQWLPAAIAYGSHLFADSVTGGVMLFAPVSTELYGFSFDWILSNVFVGVASVLFLAGWLFVLVGEQSGRPTTLGSLCRQAVTTARSGFGWSRHNRD